MIEMIDAFLFSEIEIIGCRKLKNHKIKAFWRSASCHIQPRVKSIVEGERLFVDDLGLH